MTYHRTRGLCRTQVALGAVLALASLTQFNSKADVVYREIFGHDTVTAANDNPNIYGWQLFKLDGSADTVAGGSYGVDRANSGRPVDVGNVNAGFNSDGTTTTAVATGLFLWAANQHGRLAYTPEYSFDPSAYQNLSFSWYSGNQDLNAQMHVALQINNVWYVSTAGLANSVSISSGANFATQADQETLAFDPTAAAWQILNFNGSYNGGGTPGGPAASVTASSNGTLALSANGADLSGTVTAFGLFYLNSSGTMATDQAGNIRFDTFEIDGTPLNAAPEPTSLAVLGLGSIVFIAKRKRQ
jgi:hypothetical protein